MKLLLVAFASISGYLILRQVVGDEKIALAGLVSGLIIALAALKFEERVNKTPLRIVVGGTIGLLMGLGVANLLTYPLLFHLFSDPTLYLKYSAYIFTNCVVGYLGLSIGMKKGEEFSWDIIGSLLNKNANYEKEEEKSAATTTVLDTSVIIDGRIADICDTGFIDSTLVIPQFVLVELQHIADSDDALKKARGRRGLDILERLQKETPVDVVISDENFPNVKQVDMKLVEFARKNKTKILTNDINLTKVAKLHGVNVLNINSLVNALKPVILPGEDMLILCAREGKEAGQGVGYLDDGTMVVIDGGINHVGKTIEVTVTSILQTANGRMIFSKIKEAKGSHQSVVRAIT